MKNKLKKKSKKYIKNKKLIIFHQLKLIYYFSSIEIVETIYKINDKKLIIFLFWHDNYINMWKLNWYINLYLFYFDDVYKICDN